MSGFGGVRRGPNVSQYIANLNHMPSPQDLAAQENFGLDDDLAAFTNTELFNDFDVVDGVATAAAAGGGGGREEAVRADKGEKEGYHHDAFPFSDMPYVSSTPFNFSLSAFASPMPFDSASIATTTTAINTSVANTAPSFDSPTSPTTTAITAAGSASPLDAHSRAAADEDKRRRNTAASARFRVKKKQREQALERTAREMTERADALTARITRLETENAWLKSLVVEKNAVVGRGDVGDFGTGTRASAAAAAAAAAGLGSGLGAAGEVAELWRELAGNVAQRSRVGAKKGVGTAEQEEVVMMTEDDEEKKEEEK